MRLALGICYRGGAYHGWQRQVGVPTVQQALEEALSRFAAHPVATVCAGRTDTGVHALNQVVHLDAPVERRPFSWVRGCNRYLPPDVAVTWCRPVPDDFHARNSARGRRYAYLLIDDPVRPSLDAGRVGWSFRPLDGEAMRAAAGLLVGEHDFSAFRAAECQAASPVKHLRQLRISRHGSCWRFDFEANAFLHHMVRNLMGCLVAVGQGLRPAGWVGEVLAGRDRSVAAPTFAPDGLYFLGPHYDVAMDLPRHTAAMDLLPGGPGPVDDA